MTYRLPPEDYSVADIERFTALSVRQGSTLASVVKHDARDERVVLGAYVLRLGEQGSTCTSERALEEASAFLTHEGSWLAETPRTLLDAAIQTGLLSKTLSGERSTLRVEQGVVGAVSHRRLIDEGEVARAILTERRARWRETLQARNRAINQTPAPEADPEADRAFMLMALQAAQEAANEGEIPVGAVLVADGQVQAVTHNRTRTDCDPTAHAEVLALRAAALKQGNYRLTNATLYVTLEPCPMCTGALMQARVGRVVYAAADARQGALGGALDLREVPGVNHRPLTQSGVLEDEATELLTRFFHSRR